MSTLLKVLKWLAGCCFFVIGTAMLLSVSKYNDMAPLIIVIFSYGAVFLMFETKQINKPLFGFSSVLVALCYFASKFVFVPMGYELYNVYMTWVGLLAVVGIPAMFWAYNKWD